MTRLFIMAALTFALAVAFVACQPARNTPVPPMGPRMSPPASYPCARWHARECELEPAWRVVVNWNSGKEG
jgi:hypothetical protein